MEKKAQYLSLADELKCYMQQCLVTEWNFNAPWQKTETWTFVYDRKQPLSKDSKINLPKIFYEIVRNAQEVRKTHRNVKKYCHSWNLPDSESCLSESWSELVEWSSSLLSWSVESMWPLSWGFIPLLLSNCEHTEFGPKGSVSPQLVSLSGVKGLWSKSGDRGFEGVEQYRDSLEHSSGKAGIASKFRPFMPRVWDFTKGWYCRELVVYSGRLEL